MPDINEIKLDEIEATINALGNSLSDLRTRIGKLEELETHLIETHLKKVIADVEEIKGRLQS